MSSDHADIYEGNADMTAKSESDVELRDVTVNVNDEESILSFIEPAVCDYPLERLVGDHIPDCYLVVYAVDDRQVAIFRGVFTPVVYLKWVFQKCYLRHSGKKVGL